MLELLPTIADHFDKPPVEITEDTRFSDLGADSLEMIDFLFAIETKFQVAFTPQQMDSVETVGDLVRLLEEHADHIRRAH